MSGSPRPLDATRSDDRASCCCRTPPRCRNGRRVSATVQIKAVATFTGTTTSQWPTFPASSTASMNVRVLVSRLLNRPTSRGNLRLSRTPSSPHPKNPHRMAYRASRAPLRIRKFRYSCPSTTPPEAPMPLNYSTRSRALNGAAPDNQPPQRSCPAQSSTSERLLSEARSAESARSELARTEPSTIATLSASEGGRSAFRNRHLSASTSIARCPAAPPLTTPPRCPTLARY